MAFVLSSPAFGDGDRIPQRCAQDGNNLSPPLEWRDPPPETRSFVLVVEGRETLAGPMRHWAVCDIPSDRTGLTEGIGSTETVEFRQAINDFGKRGYSGPTPAEGREWHTYRFRIAAVDVPSLGLPVPFTAGAVWVAAQPHILRQAELVGTYEQLTPRSHERPVAVEPDERDRYGHGDPAQSPTAPARQRRQPDKGEPVVHAGDASGPNSGRNLSTANLDHDSCQAPPNVLEPTAYAAEKPGRKRTKTR